MLFTITKLNTIKVFISETLTDSYINHDQFVLVNKKSKILKMLWNILRKNNGKLLCQL